SCFFFFNDAPPTEIYTVGNTLSLHDALPISVPRTRARAAGLDEPRRLDPPRSEEHTSELQSLPTISYAVFCLQKKNRSGLTHENDRIGIKAALKYVILLA